MDVAEAAGPVDRLHSLLLAMTGRVDDDGIDGARELLGMGQPDAGAEFLAGCLLAGRIEVTAAEQYHLRRVLEESRGNHQLADRLTVVESLLPDGHRFSAPGSDDTDLEISLKQVSSRLAGVRGLWITHRTTPAGNNYGAVPQGVLLAEVGPDGSGPAVAFQLISALRRAGLRYAVDVFATGADLPEYHRDALSTARRVRLEMPSAERTAPPAAPRAERAAPPVEPPAERAAPPVAPRAEHVVEHRQPEEPPAPPPAPPAPVDESRPEGVSHAVAEPQHEFPGEPPEDPEPETAAEQTGVMMRVPAAVDAKLTDRERNLLRKLHEELAHREQDGPAKRQPTEDGRSSTMPGGTGGFPPIAASQQQAYSPQQR
ncbi:hypothetical protein EIL87_17430 [Saccharopolyspora rhizosphaerae]|uniref:Uncharacterized protein n=1 Tax=Saccharopolyspora rhizosphaerae TaxID=2492662 RepID=A0A426JPQ6_9PSEU|nr:hypothetical protein EIL87_17430 [Saccharopolyspora rhizosphaerae]